MRGATPPPDRPKACRPYFNPRPPCGGRLSWLVFNTGQFEFQSTPPMRGATTQFVSCLTASLFQSTPPMRGATCSPWVMVERDAYFNPRPPCGGRLRSPSSSRLSAIFQSTPPMRGATSDTQIFYQCSPISIHAPHAGGDELQDYNKRGYI